MSAKLLNDIDKALYDKPSIETEFCPFCGRPVESRHHIVYRSHGGTNGATVTVCGRDNSSGCHGKFHHHRLHLRWIDGWEWLFTDQPVKEADALLLDGWQRLPDWSK